MLNRVSEKIPFGGGWGREGGRAEQNSGPFEMVSNFKMRFEKKKDISEGVGWQICTYLDDGGCSCDIMFMYLKIER